MRCILAAFLFLIVSGVSFGEVRKIDGKYFKVELFNIAETDAEINRAKAEVAEAEYQLSVKKDVLKSLIAKRDEYAVDVKEVKKVEVDNAIYPDINSSSGVN